MEKTIVEGNKLIAEFMDLHVPDSKEFNEHWILPEHAQKEGEVKWTLEVDVLKYHTSWDWLMPCLKKFNDLNIHDIKIRNEWLTVIGKTGSEIGKRYVALCDNIDDAVTRDYNVTHAWQSLVEAIEWYNSQSKTNKQ